MVTNSEIKIGDFVTFKRYPDSECIVIDRRCNVFEVQNICNDEMYLCDQYDLDKIEMIEIPTPKPVSAEE